MIIFNEISDKNQAGNAIWMYADALNEFNPKKIVVTGHSLAAAWETLYPQGLNAEQNLVELFFGNSDIFHM